MHFGNVETVRVLTSFKHVIPKLGRWSKKIDWFTKLPNKGVLYRLFIFLSAYLNCVYVSQNYVLVKIH